MTGGRVTGSAEGCRILNRVGAMICVARSSTPVMMFWSPRSGWIILVRIPGEIHE